MPQSINRATAGYRMLMILSAVDGIVHAKEDQIIRDYMEENFEEAINFDAEKQLMNNMDSSDFAVQFNDAMNYFYMQSSQEERNHFLDIATRLVAADKKISRKENLYIKELYYAWEDETEE